ncbi:MAG: TlyA family RNA methyltransferase [Patescibacteria group bacterium]|jgi:23S rRNA (cytidine1920-2'-O)/16S rRNA (cytidine1409-2'-O)-methyltransferase|nr:TlyA family RNA methyltransferase [Patescibacteria group bacterium]
MPKQLKTRLDQLIFDRGLVNSRSQAESYIKLGKVKVAGKVVTKPGYFVYDDSDVTLNQDEQFVSRAGLKLASVARALDLDFKDKIVLDVGSSTGGFTDYALKHGAKKVFAVDVGTNQLHPKLQGNPKIVLYEQTNVLDARYDHDTAYPKSNPKHLKEEHKEQNPTSNTQNLTEYNKVQHPTSNIKYLTSKPDIILIDVSFVSLRDILPHIAKYLATKNTLVVAMLKPQFETGEKAKNKGVIKNDAMRRAILKDFEQWVKKYFVIINKADSGVAGAKGNQERFYLLKKGDL